METPTPEEIAIAVGVVVAGLTVGFVAERLVLRWLARFAERTRWRSDNVVVAALRGVPAFWGVALGVYVATLVLDPSPAVLAVLGKVLAVAVLWSVIVVVARSAAGGVMAYAGRESSFLPPTSIIPGLIRLAVYIVGLLLVLNELSVSVTPLLTVLGVGGLAVALALQDTLSNLFAGLYLIASRKIRPGDYLRIEGEEDAGQVEGTVEDVHWRNTAMRTVLGNVVIIPNARLAGAVVTNFSLPRPGTLIRITGAVDYDADLDHAERVTREVAAAVVRELSGSAAEPPQLYFHAFGEFSLNFTVLLRARGVVEGYELRHRFIKALMARYREEGIRFPFPIREFEMELSSEGLDVGRPMRIDPADAAGSAVDDAPSPSGGTERPAP